MVILPATAPVILTVGVPIGVLLVIELGLPAKFVEAFWAAVVFVAVCPRTKTRVTPAAKTSATATAMMPAFVRRDPVVDSDGVGSSGSADSEGLRTTVALTGSVDRLPLEVDPLAIPVVGDLVGLRVLAPRSSGCVGCPFAV